MKTLLLLEKCHIFKVYLKIIYFRIPENGLIVDFYLRFFTSGLHLGLLTNAVLTGNVGTHPVTPLFVRACKCPRIFRFKLFLHIELSWIMSDDFQGNICNEIFHVRKDPWTLFPGNCMRFSRTVDSIKALPNARKS